MPPLSDTAIKALKAKDKPYKVADTNQLYVFVSAIGTRIFRLDLNIAGKRKTFTIGKYPIISLKDARLKAFEIRQTIERGEPIRMESNDFKTVSIEFLDKQRDRWSQRHYQKQLRRLEMFIFPVIGSMPINTIKPPHLIECLKPIDGVGSGEVAHKTLNLLTAIFRYGIAAYLAETDPTTALKGFLKPERNGNYKALTEPKELAEFLKAVDNYTGGMIVQVCLQILPHIFVRSGEIRTMQWQDINFETNEWRYHIGKTGTDHIVPLSSHVIERLNFIRQYTGPSPYVFHGLRETNRALSDMALTMAIRRMGFDIVPHSFRATFRTIGDEVLNFRADAQELQLAHKVSDSLSGAYNRVKLLDYRKTMMQQWSDYLLSLKQA